jgi:hypothetical protein
MEIPTATMRPRRQNAISSLGQWFRGGFAEGGSLRLTDSLFAPRIHNHFPIIHGFSENFHNTLY